MRKSSMNVFGRPVALLTILAFAAVLISASVVLADKIVDHPDKLKYKELKYQPPKPDGYRYKLDCGATAYIAENPEVPTFDLTILVRTGSMYEPVEKAGLSDMTGYLMRNGGVEGMTARELDERLAYLAGEKNPFNQRRRRNYTQYSDAGRFEDQPALFSVVCLQSQG